MTPLDVVSEYYARIDANDIDWVLTLFAHDAEYRRADSTYTGKARIDQFFRIERQIRGSHRIDAAFDITDGCVCRGSFVGVGRKGDERQVRFVDLWFFQSDGLVRLRETYLALGHEYIKN